MPDRGGVENVIHDFIYSLPAERRLYPDVYAAELAALVTAALTEPKYSAGGAVARAEALAAGDSNWMDAAGLARNSSPQRPVRFCRA